MKLPFRNKKAPATVTTLCVILFLSSHCSDPRSDDHKEKLKATVVTAITALPKKVKSPADNPLTEEKIALGKLLFYDPILSGNKDVACASCHHPSHGYAEFLDISIGVNGQGLGSNRSFVGNSDIPFVKRNAQSILNTAFNGISSYRPYDPEAAHMFWDVRVRSLEDQAIEPIKALEEMRGHAYSEDEILAEVVSRVMGIDAYRELFREAFGSNEAVSIINISKAIAAFERTLVTNNSRFDKYMRGDKDAISLSEEEGFELFKKVGCNNCHSGPMFSDFKNHVIGVPGNDKLPTPDSGVDSTFAFRTASLRNLRFTSPYMHSGHFATLKEVLEFYEDISFGKIRNPLIAKEIIDPLILELDLRVKDMGQIISFLNTLNDPNFDRDIPVSVPSGLPVGGNIQ